MFKYLFIWFANKIEDIHSLISFTLITNHSEQFTNNICMKTTKTFSNTIYSFCILCWNLCRCNHVLVQTPSQPLCTMSTSVAYPWIPYVESLSNMPEEKTVWCTNPFYILFPTHWSAWNYVGNWHSCSWNLSGR